MEKTVLNAVEELSETLHSEMKMREKLKKDQQAASTEGVCPRPARSGTTFAVPTKPAIRKELLEHYVEPTAKKLEEFVEQFLPVTHMQLLTEYHQHARRVKVTARKRQRRGSLTNNNTENEDRNNEEKVDVIDPVFGCSEDLPDSCCLNDESAVDRDEQEVRRMIITKGQEIALIQETSRLIRQKVSELARKRRQIQS